MTPDRSPDLKRGLVVLAPAIPWREGPVRSAAITTVTAIFFLAIAVLASLPSEAHADPLGQVTEYRGLTSDAQHLTLGPDGNMWFAERQVPAIGRITPNGEVTIFTAGLRTHSAPCSLAVGPDGNLWFADEGGLGGETGAIGRITPSGTITEFTAGLDSGEKPQDIVAGPDGNIWWSSFSGRGVGKITTAGAITDLSAGLNQGLEPEDVREPGGLVVGPDGSIWFNNYSEDGSAIGKIVPSDDAITEYPVPDYGVPDGVTAGGDGNVWFIDEGNETIDRITPAGVITPFDTGAILNSTEEQQPTGITLGPDGNIWFTYNGKGYGTPPPAYVGNITPAGVVTKFPAPEQYLGGITRGPDGNLWFSDHGSLARITTTGEITEFPVHAAELAAGPDGDMWFDDGEGGELIGKIGTAASPSGGNTGTGGPGSSGSSSTGSGPSTSVPALPPSPNGARSAGVKVGKTTLKLEKGTAQLSVTFPGPGKLVVGGKGIKGVTELIKKAGKTKIGVKPTAKALTKLKSRGQVSLPIKITFTPTGGKAATVSATLKLEG
jgi:streptogramin lyase